MDRPVPIAVIGMSCKFAGEATSPETLWKLCAEGRSAWSTIPLSKFNLDGVYHPNGEKADTTNVIGGHFLREDVAGFDAGFFSFPADLAACMDPQYRLQLEGTYEALESAGLSLEDVAGSNTSMYAGAFFRDYQDTQLRDPQTLPRQQMLGVGAAMAANRLSHFFDLRGPSMAIDTGCSTTLTALHQACQSLRTGESDMSIVGGANVIINSDIFVTMSSLHFLSPEGRCYAFDSRAGGYGRGEGSATVILKRLDHAMRDGDPIRAVILNTGLNQDGKTETITAPSPEAQEALIRDVYGKAGLNPGETSYFEAHGTGTPTGDPIEVRAISSVFSAGRSPDNPLLLGSVKTNIGHTETSSGLASIIRTVLAMEKGQVAPSATFKEANPALRLTERNLKVPTQLVSWPDINGIRRASINNFGYGGANAHIIMESLPSFLGSHGHLYDLPRPLVAANGWHDDMRSRVIVLSARDEQRTAAMVADLKAHLESLTDYDDEAYLDSLAYTLSQRRSRFAWRAATSVKSVSDLAAALGGPQMIPTKAASKKRNIAFVFTGQGAQWFAMGRELVAAYPVFKSGLAECDVHLRDQGASWSLMDELLKGAADSRVNELEFSTPMTVAVQVALVDLLRSWGINPVAVTSHSSGEISAAYAAGAISIRTAMAICFARGKHASQASTHLLKGAMMAIGLGPDEANLYLGRLTRGRVVIACYNSPSSITASGDASGIDELETLLKADGIFARRLKIDCAYHSHHMEAIAGPYRDWLSRVMTPEDSMTSEAAFFSPTTGKRETSGLLVSSAEHWVNSLISPVSFTQAFRNMCFDSRTDMSGTVDVVIEIGPHAALSGPIQEMLSQPDFKSTTVEYFPTLVRKSSALDTMQALASNLLKAGCDLNMDAVNFPFGRSNTEVLHDLPHYPWNHSVKHWAEPRLNRALRDRRHQVHDLLGAFTPGTNTTAPSWRHIIRLADMPWLLDHVVQGDIVYPGAGFLCMAIEAGAQLAVDEQKKILGYELRDIKMAQGLLVPDGPQGVEVQLTMRPCSDKTLYAHGWKEFQLCSVNGENEWMEHCTGRLMVEVETAGADEPPQLERHDSFMSTQRRRYGKTGDYWKQVDVNDFYAIVRTTGIHHGPIFQGLRSIHTCERRSLSTIEVADTAATMPYQHEHSHAIHPTTLDTLFQASYSAFIATPESGFKLSLPLVPHTIKRLRLRENSCAKAGVALKAYSDITKAHTTSYTTDIALFENAADTDSSEPIVEIDGFGFKAIGSGAPSQKATDIYSLDKLATVQWERDMTFTPPSELKTELQTPFDPAEGAIMTDLARVSLHYIASTVGALTETDVAQLEPHHAKYLAWMRAQVKRAGLNELAPESSTWLEDSSEVREALATKVKGESVDGEMVCRLGPRLLEILRREVTPLEIMMEEDLLNRYYEGALKWDRGSRKFAQLVKQAAAKNPRARIIEIGGGTGCATKHVLDVLGSETSGRGCQAAEYDFTDISSGFFEAAREKFADWSNLMRYKRLDIEGDLVGQGFEEGGYDMVIACQVLHATRNMEHTMANVRRLLKPGGRLFLFETTRDPMPLLLTFGLLPGWWLSDEKERQSSPSLSIGMWDRVLAKSGFGGIDVEVHDCDDEDFYNFSTIMATALPTAPSQYDPEVVIVTGSTLPPVGWLNALANRVEEITGSIPAVQTTDKLAVEGKICIFVGELTDFDMADPTDNQFAAVKVLSTESKALLWVTRGGRIDVTDPFGSVSLGFLRTLREEYQGKRVVNVDLDPTGEYWSAQSVATIGSIYRAVFDYSAPVSDFEYAEHQGTIFVPRYFKDAARNNTLFRSTGSDPQMERQSFCQPGRSLRVAVGTPGLLDTLAFVPGPEDARVLPDDYLEISPKAFGVNFRDVMTAMGELDNTLLGFECAGIVERVGTVAAAQGFRAGDRVATLMRGHFANRIQTEWTNAVLIPDNMSYEVAASIPMAFGTAYLSLFDLGRLEPGEKVLIHGASGGVGQAAVMLAQHLGAEVYVTVGTKAKRSFIKEKFGLKDDHIFSSRDVSFADNIMTETNGYGVDVVLNSLAGPLLQAGFNCLARFGRFVELGKKDLEANRFLEMEAFRRNVTFSSFDLLQMEEFRGERVQRAMKNVMDLLDRKAVHPVGPLNVHPIGEIERAFRLMQAGKHMGKVVLSVQSDYLVPVVQGRDTLRLREDATYLVVGGLGGIGRSICHWMAGRGAKNIAVLSRNANADGSCDGFIGGLSAAGIRITPIACDVSNADAVVRAIGQCEEQMPPIRGIIQGAMVLQDSIVEQMGADEYRKAVRPKVQGSWNLHKAFEGRDVDFFVMLSSLSGIAGTPSQSNYAAGNTFQDALARHRVNAGLHGAAIDLGVIKSIGYLVDHKDQLERLRKQGYHVLEEEDVMTAIESAITSNPQEQMLLGANGTNLDETMDARFWSIPRRPKNGGAGDVALKTASGDLGAALMGAVTLQAASQAVLDTLIQKLSDMFMLSPAGIDPAGSLSALGVDSLVAVELRNLLALRASAEVSIFDIMQSTSLSALAEKVAVKSSYTDTALLRKEAA